MNLLAITRKQYKQEDINDLGTMLFNVLHWHELFFQLKHQVHGHV